MATAKKKPVKIVSDALTVVNRIRKFEGKKPLKELPKGIVKSAMNCPIGNALDNDYEIDDGHLEVDLELGMYLIQQGLAKPAQDFCGTITITTPKAIAKFVEWFDRQGSEEARKFAEKETFDD